MYSHKFVGFKKWLLGKVKNMIFAVNSRFATKKKCV